MKISKFIQKTFNPSKSDLESTLEKEQLKTKIAKEKGKQSKSGGSGISFKPNLSALTGGK